MEFDPRLKKTAETLVAYCKAGEEYKGLAELYTKDAVSVEAVTMPGADSPETHGLDGIRAKHDWWNGAFEVHEATVTGPFLHGADRFSVYFTLDTTNKENGAREQMSEIGVYTVVDGKITREEFFYAVD
ncbi:MAG: nuclear transport factor 2 family protein [Pseudomonadota bacterium]